MYCWNCGKEMDDELLFCPHCAMKQAGVPEPKPVRKKRTLWPLACIAVCILVFAASLTGILILTAGEQPYSRPTDPYSVELPDPASFLNTQYTWDDVSAFTHYVTCSLKGQTGRTATQEFLELLQADCWQLVLEDSWDYAEGKALCTDYIFRYTGKGEGIGWVHHADGYKYHAKLTVHEHESGSVIVTFYTHPGFILTDPGVTAKAVTK